MSQDRGITMELPAPLPAALRITERQAQGNTLREEPPLAASTMAVPGVVTTGGQLGPPATEAGAARTPAAVFTAADETVRFGGNNASLD
jgi:hypothetical protein